MTTCEGARSGEGEPGWAWARGPEVAGGLGKGFPRRGEPALACVCVRKRACAACLVSMGQTLGTTRRVSPSERGAETWREMRVGWLQPACDGATCEAHG